MCCVKKRWLGETTLLIMREELFSALVIISFHPEVQR